MSRAPPVSIFAGRAEGYTCVTLTHTGAGRTRKQCHPGGQRRARPYKGRRVYGGIDSEVP